MPTHVASRAALAAGQTVRVNVRSVANTKKVRREKRNGRDVIIVPSATMPDDVVMNEIQYPAKEIAKSFASLNRTPAPLGHPTINGKFVSARDPEGINIGWIGAWNENVRQEKGRVLLDKVIDVERANQSEAGKRVLDAIEKGEPVHTSTGLLCMLDAANGDVDFKFSARDIEFDHDAILLDEEGAATPAQGVGMLVNARGEQEEIEVINSVIEDDAERELGWAVDSLARAMERRQRATLLDRMKTAIVDLFGSERETSTNEKENAMPVTDEQFKALSAEVKTLSDGIAEKITNAVTAAVKPLIDAQAQMAANQKAKDDAELSGLVEKIVKANLMDEAAAKELTLNAARALAKKAEPGKAAPLNGAFKPASEKKGFALPKSDKEG